MILPSKVRVWWERWSTWPDGTARWSTGKATNGTNAVPPRTLTPSSPRRVSDCRKNRMSSLGHSSLAREQSLRTLLDEYDDEHQHRNLGQHGAGPSLEEFVDDAQAHRRVDSPGELTDAAEHHDHE